MKFVLKEICIWDFFHVDLLQNKNETHTTMEKYAYY